MARRMPILGQHDVLEPLGQPIDQRHDLVAARNCQPPAGAEVVLDVDDHQDVSIADHDFLRSCCALARGRQAAVASAASRISASPTSTG